MRFDRLPVNDLREQRVDVRDTWCPLSGDKYQVLPVPNARHQADAEEMGEREDRRRLPLRVRVDRVRLNVG